MAHRLIYGGTFDPIHVGHLIAARAAREALHAEQVVFLPARISPHKQGEPPGATGEQRVEMVRRAIAGASDLDVDARELHRPPPSYTVDSVREICRDHPQDHFTLLIGSDQLAKFHAWHDVAGLMDAVGIGVLRRSGAPIERSLAAVREHLGPQAAEHVQQALLQTPIIDISSTAIRHRVARGLTIDFLVPPAVAAYIAENNLYRL